MPKKYYFWTKIKTKYKAYQKHSRRSSISWGLSQALTSNYAHNIPMGSHTLASKP